MREAQKQVEEFHRAFEIAIGDKSKPHLDAPALRISLIEEEAREFQEAVNKGDLVEAVDALCDLIYVALGAAITFGIELEPFFNEVHRSNMAKVGGGKREDGKHLKPLGWTPPDIKGILEKRINYHSGSYDGALAIETFGDKIFQLSKSDEIIKSIMIGFFRGNVFLSAALKEIAEYMIDSQSEI